MEAELLKLLKEKLSVRLKTEEIYNGGCDGSGNMYKTELIVEIYFGDELVAES